MKSGARNQWLVSDTIKVYLRKGHHPIGDKIAKTLDIANIELEERGQGTGTALINWLHEQNPFEATYIESILNNRLYDHLKRLDWLDVPRSNPPSVYKVKPTKE